MKYGPEISLPSITHKTRVGSVDVYTTVDFQGEKPIRIGIKSTDGWQGWCKALADAATLALEHGATLAEVAEMWRHQAFKPDGFGEAGDGFHKSIPDGIAKWLTAEFGEKENKQEDEA